MKPEKQRIVIARLHGWEGVPCEQSWQHCPTYGRYWRSLPPKCAHKYSSSFTASMVKRWLKTPDGSIFVKKCFAGNINHKDTYALSPVLEYFKGGWDEQVNPWPKLKPDLTPFLKYLPNYLEDLNLIHEVLRTAFPEIRIKTANFLMNKCGGGWGFATAVEWCEAYLRAVNKWEDS